MSAATFVCKCRHDRGQHDEDGCSAGDWRINLSNTEMRWAWCPCARFQQSVGISLEDHLAYVEATERAVAGGGGR